MTTARSPRSNISRKTSSVMGGPGLMALMGKCKTLPKVDAPRNKKILVDVEAYHSLLIRADKFDAVRFVKNVLFQKFAGLDVEYFFDGDGNAEKFRTSMQRRGTTSDLDAAESRIRTMEELASRGHGIKKTDYKIVQKALRSSTAVTYDFKTAVVQAMRAEGAIVYFDAGEADLTIRRRGWQLLDNWIDFVVVGNDCDYALHPTTSTLLRPSGIVRNTKIIKSISYESDSILHILNSYGDHPDVKAAQIQYEQLNEADRPEQLVDFSASRGIFIDGQETPLTTVQREIKRFREYQLDQQVQGLKSRMLEASRTRRQVIKAKKNPRFNRQQEHQLQIIKRREERDPAISERALACEKEHMDQGFDQLPSKQYGIRVRMIQGPPESVVDTQNEVNIMEELQFKDFKPYTSVGTVAPRTAPRTSTHTPEQRTMNKRDVIKSVTGSHQIATLAVGQLGRNVAHTVLPWKISVDSAIDTKTALAAQAGAATVKTIRRLVRVANAIVWHGQKALALFTSSATPEQLHRLKDIIFDKHQHGTVERAIEEAAKKRLKLLATTTTATAVISGSTKHKTGKTKHRSK
ncbi:hypothetical protein BGZ67_003550 [Mortierella alpina]|nr:hypothetical protein BGZ67_003550 [Mortierella alpina]